MLGFRIVTAGQFFPQAWWLESKQRGRQIIRRRDRRKGTRARKSFVPAATQTRSASNLSEAFWDREQWPGASYLNPDTD